MTHLFELGEQRQHDWDTAMPTTKAGVKFDQGKPRAALVLGGFSKALMEVSKVGTFGAGKYSPNGWRTVPHGVERYSDAMMRHWFSEAEVDDESGLLHAAHVAWNSLAVLELMLQKRKQGE